MKNEPKERKEDRKANKRIEKMKKKYEHYFA